MTAAKTAKTAAKTTDAANGTDAAAFAAAANNAKPAAKRGRKSAADLADLPPLDLSNLAVQTGVEMPKAKRQAAENPFIGHVKDSYEMEDARAVVIAEANASRVESMIRRAADALTEETGTPVGVSIHRSEADDAGNVTITFAAKDRRKRTVKTEAATAAPAAE